MYACIYNIDNVPICHSTADPPGLGSFESGSMSCPFVNLWAPNKRVAAAEERGYGFSLNLWIDG